MRRWAAPAICGALAVEVGVIVWYAATHSPLDLRVYMGGGHAVPGDTRLYLVQVTGHWFTYPPFAAVLFAPITAIPVAIARVTWELLPDNRAGLSRLHDQARLPGVQGNRWRASSTALRRPG